ncbi:MAG TPA: MarR family transcriptional regulator [Arachnia sp.]|nr:MarR family transcriptional regulator [Arachnia sp.]HMT86951.1 MarR family transcriptional regulator [Arachnia sp.]
MSASTRSSRRLPSRRELAVWRAYFETSQELHRLVGARLQADSGLSNPDYAVMVTLSEAVQRTMRSSDLAAHIGWDRSRLSHHLGRMEKRGLIRRERCADDSRGALIVLTDDGLQLYRRCSVPHLCDIRELFVDALTPHQLAAIGEATAALRTHLDSLVDKATEVPDPTTTKETT